MNIILFYEKESINSFIFMKIKVSKFCIKYLEHYFLFLFIKDKKLYAMILNIICDLRVMLRVMFTTGFYYLIIIT